MIVLYIEFSFVFSIMTKYEVELISLQNRKYENRTRASRQKVSREGLQCNHVGGIRPLRGALIQTLEFLEIRPM